MKRQMSEEQKELLRQKAKEAWAKRRMEAAARAQESASNQVPQISIETDVERMDVLDTDKQIADRPLKQQSRAIQARWAGEQAAEEELRQHFLTIPLDKAFFVYEKMRKNLETAGRILNDRANKPEIQKCKTCGITLEKMQETSRKNDWFLNRPHYKEGDRNVIIVDHFCSAACISLENNKTQGVYGMSDRGMLPKDNPRNHPREFPGQKGA